MIRSIALVLLAATLLVGVGVVVYGRVFGPPPPVVVATVPPPVVALVAVPTTSTAPADAGVTATVAEPQVTVLTARRGSVQIRHGDDGEWRDAEESARLGADDVVRAGRNAEATLQLGNGVEVNLSPRSELRIRELTEAIARVRLDEGHVTATVDGDGRRILRVQAKGSDAEAESTGGTFGVVTDGDGQLAVAATTGRVRVSANGGSVDVEAGQTTSVTAGKAPSPPTAVPGSLYLKLGALAATQTNQTATTVSGTTAPGSLVRVRDLAATSDAKGRFSMKVPLRDGKNDIAVEVVDASGRRQDSKLPVVTVDRKKPTIDAKVQWGKAN